MAPHNSSASQTTFPQPRRARARRGSAQDHAACREQIIRAAFDLHRNKGGLNAISMRTLATEVGLSAMGLYRYFDGKGAVLVAMSELVVREAVDQTTYTASRGASARERLRLGTAGFINYWEAHPDNFRLVYATEELLNPSTSNANSDAAPLLSATGRVPDLVSDFVIELGGDLNQVAAASDLRFALMFGYLCSRIIHSRLPWGDPESMRENAIQAIMLGVEACVMPNRVGL